MKIFIAGICGTFMAGLAQLAKAGGHSVRGCDAKTYPPMSTLLESHAIEVAQGWLPEHLGDDPGMVVIGNILSRGNPLVEQVLNRELAFCSGPAWLREQVLAQRQVIAVAGTHGKTTTSSILAWILQCARQHPGYLIGGKPGNFDQSAALGNGAYFVIEADEYDTAFFDKRAKFVHYRPHIAVLNNLEFDHADIYDDIGQIAAQFHHLVRTVPGNGCIVVNADDARLAEVIDMGCWSRIVHFSVADAGAEAEWRAVAVREDCSRFDILHHGRTAAQVDWPCIGRHNMQNALAALAAAQLAGVPPEAAGEYLRTYRAVERRLQLLFQSDEASLYDDFAHHPSAIRETLAAVRARHPHSRIIAVVALRSNTMKMGGHGEQLAVALQGADCAIVSGAGAGANARLPGTRQSRGEILHIEPIDEIVSAIQPRRSGNDIIVTMSNGDFGGLTRRIAESLEPAQVARPSRRA